MKGLERRLARLETASHAREQALVGPDALEKMAAVIEAERARIREKLMSDGPHEPAEAHPGVECDARRILRQKLLPDDVPPAAEEVQA